MCSRFHLCFVPEVEADKGELEEKKHQEILKGWEEQKKKEEAREHRNSLRRSLRKMKKEKTLEAHAKHEDA